MATPRHILAGALLCAAGYAGCAAALTFDDVPSIETIAAEASLAFRGVVTGIEYADAQLDESHSYPYTLTHLRALACYRGCEPGQEITVAHLGGPRHGDMHHYLMIPGVASFSAGEEVVLFTNDVMHPFFGSAYGDYGVLRVARADGGARVVLDNNGEFMRDRGGVLRADGSRRCEAVAGQPQDCVSSTHAVDESDDASARAVAAPSGAGALAPEALDARMRDIVRTHRLEQAPQSVSGSAQAFERALADAYRRTTATR